MKVTLPIFHHTDESQKAKDLGLYEDFSADQLEIRYLTFYRIDVVGIYRDRDDNKKYAEIFSGGYSWTSSISVAEVEKLIDESL